MIPRTGSIVGWWQGNRLAIGLVAGEEKQRVRLVRARGKDERLKPERIVIVVDPETSPLTDDPEGRAAAGERVATIEERVGGDARRVDVPLLWEIASEPGDGGTLSIVQLAELALESAAGGACAAVLMALAADALHFVRRGDGWVPREADAVASLRDERERLARRQAESEEFLERLSLAVRGEAYRSPGTETERCGLDALERLAVEGERAAEEVRAAAREILEACEISCTRPHEGAFRLLRLVGRFASDDENLQVRRFGLRTSFPDAVRRVASERGSRGFERAGRRDLTGLAALSIDGPHTREIDDLLSLDARPAGGWRLGVHIADPGAFVDFDDEIDREALSRGQTHYMPDLRLPMLPPEISEGAASLVAGEERPALSFLADLDAEGAVVGHEIVRSVVRSERRLTYDEADQAVAAGESVFSNFAEVGRLRENTRRRAGAVTIRAPEVDLHVDPQGRISLERIAADSPSRLAVSEAMVLVGDLAARLCVDTGLPAVFRRQAAPAAPPESLEPGSWDPLAARRLRRSLRRAVTGLEPGPHAGLGLEAYLQVSSPLRRYLDLTLQRQIVSHLCGRGPSYDVESLRRIAATAERAEADARRAEESANEYWLLRHMESFVGREVEGTVVENDRRVIVLLDETMRERPVPGLTDVEPGCRVRLTVVRVVPRAGLLTLRP